MSFGFYQILFDNRGITLYVARIDIFDVNKPITQKTLTRLQRGIKMNKIAPVPDLDTLDKAINRAADDQDLSNAEKMFLKRKLEGEIRVKLAKFANELSQARNLRSKK